MATASRLLVAKPSAAAVPLRLPTALVARGFAAPPTASPIRRPPQPGGSHQKQQHQNNNNNNNHNHNHNQQQQQQQQQQPNQQNSRASHMRDNRRSGARGNGNGSNPTMRGVVNPNLNEAIRAREVRLIFGDENSIVSKAEALSRARAEGLDLVAVAPDANPVVCKLMDYSKEAYKKRVAAKESKQRQKTTTIGSMKEMKMKGLIEDHDLGIKCGKIADALAKHHPVKVHVTSNFRMLRQRPNCLKELPARLLAILDERAVPYSVVNQNAQQTRVEMMLMPERPTAAGSSDNKTQKKHKHKKSQ